MLNIAATIFKPLFNHPFNSSRQPLVNFEENCPPREIPRIRNAQNHNEPSNTNMFKFSNASTFQLPCLYMIQFDGSNPLDWLFRAGGYFDFYHTPEEQMLLIASFYMTSYKWLHKNWEVSSLEEFSRALELRFFPSSQEKHHKALFKLTRKENVVEYRKKFEAISNRVKGLMDENLLYYFISSSKRKIRKEIALHNPHTMLDAIGLAKLVIPS